MGLDVHIDMDRTGRPYFKHGQSEEDKKRKSIEYQAKQQSMALKYRKAAADSDIDESIRKEYARRADALEGKKAMSLNAKVSFVLDYIAKNPNDPKAKQAYLLMVKKGYIQP
jgi:phage protein D